MAIHQELHPRTIELYDNTYVFTFHQNIGNTQSDHVPAADVYCNASHYGWLTYVEIEDIDGRMGGRWTIRLNTNDILSYPTLTSLLAHSITFLRDRHYYRPIVRTKHETEA